MPTTNPVPSTDPSDLLFNAGKLDEVVNGTANSFTDRLGATRRTVAGMNADFDAQLADAESDLNVYRADAAASAAEALGYLQTIRATSYGAYASDPATDPLGNPPTVGDEYFNTTANLLKRWNGTTWQASDINTANLAASSGSSLIGYDNETVQSVLDGAKSLQDYSALRAYNGRATRIYITGLLVTAKPAGIAGQFQYDPTDTISADNGGTIIVLADGRRFKRDFSGKINAKWFGAGVGASDDSGSINNAINAGYLSVNGNKNIEVEMPDGDYKLTGTIVVKNGMKLSLGNRAVIYPYADIDAVRIGAGSTISGGKIDYVYAAPSATKAAIVVEKNIGLSGAKIRDVLVRGNPANSGTGIYLYDDVSGQGSSFVEITGCQILFFDSGLKMEAKNGSFTTGHSVRGCFISYCKRPVVLDGVGGSRFDIVTQHGAMTINHALIKNTTQCEFSAVIYDTLIGKNTIVLSDGSNNNKILTNLSESYVTDVGGLNIVSSGLRQERSYGNNELTVTLPEAVKGALHSDIHDYLAYADKRFSVVASTSPARPIANLFSPDGEYVEWPNTTALPLTIEITLSATGADPAGIDIIGFTYSYITPVVDISVYMFATGTWESVMTYTATATDQTNALFATLSYAQSVGASKIRLTFTGPFGSGYLNRVKLYRIFGLASKKRGQVFLHKDGGDLYGDLSFSVIGKGSVVRTPDGTKKYRIGVDNNGAVVTTLVS